MGPLPQFVRDVARAQAPAGADASLLAAFVERHDAAAFTALVERHGPMVWAVCRRAVWRAADAEDAFQAVFLVLAKKARAVNATAGLAGWLHGVAANVGKKARAAAARRAARERPLGDTDVPARPRADADPFGDPALDEAIASLPASLREPLVLCELEGVTRREAALRLAIPEGTVASRVARAKARLARTLAAPSLLAATWVGVAPPAPAADLVSRTVDAALGAGSYVPAAAPAAAYAREVLTEMTLHKFKTVAVLAAGATGLAVTAGVRFDTPAPALAAPAPPPKPATVTGVDLTAKVLRPSDELNLRLLRAEAVRKDLGLTDDDAATVADATTKVEEAFKAKLMGMSAAGMRGQGGGVIVGGKIPIPAGAQGGGAVIPVQGIPLPAGGVMPAQGVPIAGGRVSVNSSSKGFSADELNDEFFGPKSDFAKAVQPLLTEARVKRLRQLDLAATGPAAFANRRVVRLLGLTEAQEDEIEIIQKKFKADTRDLFLDPAKAGEFQDAATAACVKLLTPDQRDLWTACVGAPVPAAGLLASTQSLTPAAVFGRAAK